MSIGSNDVLKNCVIQAAGAVGIHTEYKQIYPELKARYLEHPAEMTEMLADLRKVKQELRENQEVLDICDQFEGKFEHIIRMIKEKNPYVVIYADNVYNPYVAVNYTYGPIEVLNLSELTETYIRRINEAFHSSSKEYTVINAYSIFQKDGYTNVKAGTLENLEKFNLDPHPNREGHIQIAEKIYEKLDLTPPKAKAVREDAKIEITADEKVRFVEGKHLYLKSEEKSYSYELTGKENHLKAAKLFENEKLFYPMEEECDTLEDMHANQHIPQIIGAMDLYRATGDEIYWEIGKNFWNIVTGGHTYCIGGVGETEMFHRANTTCSYLTDKAAESCASYNMLRLTSQLFEYTRSGNLMDYYDNTLRNHILTSSSHKCDGGTTYFLPLGPGGRKEFFLSENSLSLIHI